MTITTPGFYRLTKPVEYDEGGKHKVYPPGCVVLVTEVNTGHDQINIPRLRGWQQNTLECEPYIRPDL